MELGGGGGGGGGGNDRIIVMHHDSLLISIYKHSRQITPVRQKSTLQRQA